MLLDSPLFDCGSVSALVEDAASDNRWLSVCAAHALLLLLASCCFMESSPM